METKCLHLLSIFCSLSAMLCTHRNNIYGIHFLLAFLIVSCNQQEPTLRLSCHDNSVYCTYDLGASAPSISLILPSFSRINALLQSRQANSSVIIGFFSNCVCPKIG